jgi:putative hydrolase of the HAD superfamily
MTELGPGDTNIKITARSARTARCRKNVIAGGDDIDRMLARATMSGRPYDAVLCDIDGVLRHWPAADDIEIAHELPLGSLAAAAFRPSRLKPAITGSITDAQWRSEVARDLAYTCGSMSRAQSVVRAWSSLEPRPDDQVVSLLARARQFVTVALVSNATTRLEQDLGQLGLGDVADIVISSARIGVAKPDPGFYVIAAERAGTSVGRCLFIDDTAANVAAASEAGMIGVHYRRSKDLSAALAPLWAARPSAMSTSNLQAALRAALTPSLNSRDSIATAAIRSALTAIANAEVVPPAQVSSRRTSSEHVAGAVAGLGVAEAPRRELSEADIAAIVSTEITDRLSAAEEYERLGRSDQSARLRREAAVLSDLLTVQG